MTIDISTRSAAPTRRPARRRQPHRRVPHRRRPGPGGPRRELSAAARRLPGHRGRVRLRQVGHLDGDHRPAAQERADHRLGPVPRPGAARARPRRSTPAIRGNKISMIFQDPLTSLNPVYTVGNQIAEAVLAHNDVSKKTAHDRAVDLLGAVGIPFPEQRVRQLPARDVGRHAPAGRHRDRDGEQPGRDHRRRADHGSGRHRAGPGAGGARGGACGDRRRAGSDHPRPRRDRRARRPHLRHVRRASLSRRAVSTTSSTARGCPTRSACSGSLPRLDESGQESAHPDRRVAAVAAEPAGRLPVHAALPACPGHLRAGGARADHRPIPRPTWPPAISTTGWSA